MKTCCRSAGLMRVGGSDGLEGECSWIRFWLLGLVPIVRDGGSLDHLRAAFGQAVAEAAFWTRRGAPAPGRRDLGSGGRRHRPSHTPARGPVPDRRHPGRCRRAPAFGLDPRSTNANPEREYRLQPFGGTLSDFRTVDGCRMPSRVEGGNFFGTKAYFPFYRAEVEAIRFLPSGGGR